MQTRKYPHAGTNFLGQTQQIDVETATLTQPDGPFPEHTQSLSSLSTPSEYCTEVCQSQEYKE